jgi:hypothetical protein
MILNESRDNENCVHKNCHVLVCHKNLDNIDNMFLSVVVFISKFCVYWG